ncbi:MAG: zinc-dependent alcohol dehydrogenase family protein [Anaerolineales bacterium]|nr:zinc-dependent alcohol dehydrogenase family protein [Anaerolineales bacterium]
MRAMPLTAHHPAETHPLTLSERNIPHPTRGELLLRVILCGVCHTDLHTLEGDIHPPKLPVVPGHQVVGVVEEMGEPLPGGTGVPHYERLKVGDRVGVPWLYSACGTCEFCLRGLENLCPNAKFTGFHVDGGYADYMIADARYALPLPDAISDEQAAPLLCAGIVGYRSLKLADIQPGERVGLAGFGASAHLCLQVLNHWGCDAFVFTRSAGHRAHARELGAVWAGAVEDNGDAGETPGVALDRIVVFAPVGALVPVMLEKLRPGGTLALNAIHMSPIPEFPYHLLWGERTVRSVANATRQDGVEFLKLAAEIPIRATTTVYPLERANEALLDMKHSRINGEAVLMM